MLINWAKVALIDLALGVVTSLSIMMSVFPLFMGTPDVLGHLMLSLLVPLMVTLCLLRAFFLPRMIFGHLRTGKAILISILIYSLTTMSLTIMFAIEVFG